MEIENSGIPTVREETKKLSNQKNKKSKRFSLLPQFGCMRLNDDVSVAERPDVSRRFNVEAASDGRNQVPTPSHLIVMVNGIIGSAQNWRYAAKQFVKAYPDDVLVHCSECNSTMLTFDGVDVMGKRLADEVVSVVNRHSSLQKISFVSHSLGGLVARYAIALLYQQELERELVKGNGDCEGLESNGSYEEENIRARIAGLEPVNFITSATPHLGSRGHKQVPVFCGFQTMEKAASHASWLLGRTGKHLFLSDGDDRKPPLLIQMSSDSEDLNFISALESFKRRVAYANARFDYLVGWSSSSLRRLDELPKRRYLVKSGKYRHIFSEEASKTANSQEVSLDNKAARGRTSEMEESMIRGLTRLSWERVDVIFHGTIQQLLAHNTIQVKTYCINYAGAGVIQHMIDNFQL